MSINFNETFCQRTFIKESETWQEGEAEPDLPASKQNPALSEDLATNLQCTSEDPGDHRYHGRIHSHVVKVVRAGEKNGFCLGKVRRASQRRLH